MLTDDLGELPSLDQEDPVTVFSYPIHSKYVFTGVPWAAPRVNGVTTSSLSTQGSQNLTLEGFAFARSPFSKCFLKGPPKFQDESTKDSW